MFENAPSQSDAFDFLIEEYDRGIAELDNLYNTVNNSPLTQFISNESFDIGRRLVSLEKAHEQYTSYMWQRAFLLTDALDFMPADLRSAWNKFVETGNGCDLTPRRQLEYGFITDVNNPIKFDGIPEFTEAGVRTTIGILMKMRSSFLVSMVDGIFFNLSGAHVTNRPEGFAKRFIIDNVYEYRDCYLNFGSYCKARFIHDLRFVIGKLLVRQPKLYANSSHGDTSEVIDTIIKAVGFGEWCWIDGNAIRIRCYKKGTVHIELHPTLILQLNSILASKYPNAIPSKFRTASKSTRKDRVLLKRVVPDEVVGSMRRFSVNLNFYSYTAKFEYVASEQAVRDEIDDIMEMAGGRALRDGYMTVSYKFSYNPTDVINYILLTRAVPDRKSHQFYPSPVVVVDSIVDYMRQTPVLAGADSICEPSCGTGNLIAGLLTLNPVALQGYEVNPTFAKVAETRFKQNAGVGVKVVDFLDMGDVRFDVVAMNPPFNEGRWLEHVRHALTLSDEVVAVLPAGADLDRVPCSKVVEVAIIDNSFEGTSISVKIVHFTK